EVEVETGSPPMHPPEALQEGTPWRAPVDLSAWAADVMQGLSGLSARASSTTDQVVLVLRGVLGVEDDWGEIHTRINGGV
ncbi:MAG: hypothetical protein KC656_34330, partial [Myxococcales bacterium]|nr:hypothetical protein [Myxococcales bacterium]